MAVHSLQRAARWKIGIYLIPITKALRRNKRKPGDDDFEVETRNNPPRQVKVSATTVGCMCERRAGTTELELEARRDELDDNAELGRRDEEDRTVIGSVPLCCAFSICICESFATTPYALLSA